MATKINTRTVNGLKAAEKDQFIWDSELKGFGLKVTPAGSKVYIVQYRTGGRGSPTRRYTIGKHGAPWTADKARNKALSILGDVADGLDPQSDKSSERQAFTVSQLCDLYLAEGCETKKASTIATDKGRIERHIKPLIGNKRVKDLTANDIRRFMSDVANGKTATKVKTGKHGLARVKGGKGTATRTVGLLGGILSYAVSAGIIPSNPAQGVQRYPDKRHERYLSIAELNRLGEALVKAEKDGEHPYAIQAIRLLLLTGCRKSEVLALRWDEVDFEHGCLRLKDSKTGQKVVLLGAPALKVLDEIAEVEGSDYVFPSLKSAGHYVGLPKAWVRIRKLAKLDDVRLHDLRHSFASVGASAGMGLQMVGKLLGHADPKTTARYAHIADDPARVAANSISGAINAAISETSTVHLIDTIPKSRKDRGYE